MDEGHVCLRPDEAGRTQELRFTMSGGSGACATTYALEEAYVDDIVVGTHPDCPGS